MTTDHLNPLGLGHTWHDVSRSIDFPRSRRRRSWQRLLGRLAFRLGRIVG